MRRYIDEFGFPRKSSTNPSPLKSFTDCGSDAVQKPLNSLPHDPPKPGFGAFSRRMRILNCSKDTIL
ncbi:hypothetical protein LINGRAHAP2_LOCUS30089 [Linum grandiflorum]